MLDLFADRYGWTIKEVHSLPVRDFLGYLFAAREAIREEHKREMNIAAFTGWQIYSLLAGMNPRKKGDPPPMNLAEYRDSLGLLSDEEKERLQLMKDISRMTAKSQVKKNIEKAENILNLDKARQEKAEKGR